MYKHSGVGSSQLLGAALTAVPLAGQAGLAELVLTLPLIFTHVGQNSSKLDVSLSLVLVFS